MQKMCVLCVALMAATPAAAHFIWILPDANGKPAARIVFSDALKPDENAELLKKIQHTDMFARGGDGRIVPLKLTDRKDTLLVAVPDANPMLVAGVCRYGVFARGNTDPFLLYYYAKSFTGLTPKDRSPELLSKSCDKLPLEIVPVMDGKAGPAVRVLWNGKPQSGAEVVVLAGADDKPPTGKTDADGLFKLENLKESGLIGIRALHVEAKSGELDGKKYQAIRHYATLTMPASASASR